MFCHKNVTNPQISINRIDLRRNLYFAFWRNFTEFFLKCKWNLALCHSLCLMGVTALCWLIVGITSLTGCSLHTECEHSLHNIQIISNQATIQCLFHCPCVWCHCCRLCWYGQDSSSLSSLSSAVPRPGNKHGFSRLPPYGSVQEILTSVSDLSAENEQKYCPGASPPTQSVIRVVHHVWPRSDIPKASYCWPASSEDTVLTQDINLYCEQTLCMIL